MRAGEWGKWPLLKTSGLKGSQSPSPGQRMFPHCLWGSQSPDLPKTLSAERCPFQFPMSLLGVGGCEAAQAHACPAVGVGLDFMWDLPNPGQKAMASPLLGFLSLPRSPSRPGRPGSPGCPAMTEGKERAGAPGGPAGPWRPGKPAENK